MMLDKKKTDEGAGEQSFKEMLDQSFVDPGRLEPGQQLETVIVKITKEWTFLDLGGKSEGCLATKELLDEDGNLIAKEGDTIRAYFLSADKDEQLFTTRLGRGAAGQAYLEDAWRSHIPLEGHVEKEIKGGFEVKIAGNVRGFCPYSQMGLRRADNSAEHVGKRLSFFITEYGENGRNIVLSNRAILEAERKSRKEALKATLKEGMKVKGTVSSIRDYGAFVDIGGVEGLLPISEIGWGRVEDIRALLTEGQEIEVAVMKLDWEKDRFSLSMKETLPDPWESVEQKFPEGSCHTGKVVLLTRFGAFVTLGPGVDGLIHISNLGAGKRINHPREVLTENQTLQVRVERVEKEKKRLSLSLDLAERDAQQADAQNEDGFQRYLQKNRKQSSRSLGTLGDVLKAKLAEKAKR